MALQWKFSSAASFLQLPQGAELLTPSTAQKQEMLSTLPPAPERQLLNKDQVARPPYEIARLLGLRLTLSWKDKASKIITEGSLSVPITAPWHEGTFSIENVPSMLIMDKDLYEALESIPGIVLESITYTEGTWKITGLCYGT